MRFAACWTLEEPDGGSRAKDGQLSDRRHSPSRQKDQSDDMEEEIEVGEGAMEQRITCLVSLFLQQSQQPANRPSS